MEYSAEAAERDSHPRKRWIVSRFQKYALNPPLKLLGAAGLLPPIYAVIETTGRRSGKRRRTPVANVKHGDVFWIVAGNGRRTDYVRNLQANPVVRIRIGRRWYQGTAKVLDVDDVEQRLRTMRRVNSIASRLTATDPVTVRVALAQ